MIKYKIVSDSMTPLISIGDEIIIKKLEPGLKLKKFDIILYQNGEKLMCHYFWHQNKLFDQGFIITRNLKSGNFDYPFELNNVLGVVINFKINFLLKFKIILKDKFFNLPVD
jgi:signal peptidase I